MKKLKIGFYGFMIAISVYSIIQSLTYGLSKEFGPGPGLFPLIMGVAILVLSIFQLFSKDVLRNDNADSFLSRKEIIRIGSIAFIVGLTIGLLETLGFIIITVAFSYVILRHFERWTTKKSLLISIVIPVILWALFGLAFNLPLPEGILSNVIW